jgi:hypothetical protein
MAYKLNKEGLKHAKQLIKDGKYVVGSDWSEVQPSSEDENKFLDKEGWEAYARWHLAYDPEANEETKERYGFPYGDFKKVHRSALNAVQQRAGQYDYDKIGEAGDDLVALIDKQDA